LQILISLGEGSKTLSDLRTVTGSTSQSILPRIRFLEERHYIDYQNDGYTLTPQGKVLSSHIQDYLRSTVLFDKNPAFWSSHYLEAIPEPFLRDIGALADSTIVESSDADIFSVIQYFFEMLKNAPWIHIISSFMSHPHADALGEKIKEGVPVEMVVTTRVAEELRNEPFRKKMEDLLEYRHFRVYVAPTPLLIGLTVTDSFLSFGMCLRGSLKYDISSDLFSTDRKALIWGERLFTYYKEISEEFSLDNPALEPEGHPPAS
jgi:predicted transcriptional regulator